jgi:tRNA-5-methyluridine54 2-sulfurtransferase
MFYWGFLAKQKIESIDRPSMAESDRAILQPCSKCSQPTTSEICGYCRMMARAQTV